MQKGHIDPPLKFRAMELKLSFSPPMRDTVENLPILSKTANFLQYGWASTNAPFE